MEGRERRWEMNGPESYEASPHLQEYYHILTKHRWIIIISLILMVTLTLLYTFQMKPVYQATVTMVIEKEQSKSPLTGERMDFEGYASEALTFNTHFKLITSRPVLERVITELKLDQIDSQEGIEVSAWRELLSQFKENLRLLLGREEKILSPEEKLTQFTETLRKKVDIEQVRDTRLLRLNLEDHDPVMAMKIANSLAKSYIEFNIDNRLKSSKNTLSWMTDQLYQMKKKLEDSEEGFLAYKEREKLFSVVGKQQVISQKIQEFNDAYIKARNRRLELDAKLAELRRSLQSKGDILHARSLINNPLLDSLYTQLLDSEVELTRLSKVYKQMHPKLIQIQTKIDNTEQKFKEEIKKELENLVSERTVLLARENVLQKTLADFEDDGLQTNRKELQYTILDRNVQTNQKLYDTLLSRVQESNIMGNVDISNIRVAEAAVLPPGPIKPKKRLNAVLSVIFGLMTGLGLAFLLEYIDRSLRTEEDIQRYLGLPVLSVIPKAESVKKQ
ncbi:MAG: GumC family protein [Pseudomonadota bacterium]